MLRAALVDAEEQGTGELLNPLGRYWKEAHSARCWSEMFRADKENRKEELVGLKLVPKENDTWTSNNPLVKCLVIMELLFPHTICISTLC